MHCPFPTNTRGTICPICKIELQFPADPDFEYETIPRRPCPVLWNQREVCTEWEPLLGMGDIVGDSLSWFGITPERWEKLVTWLATRFDKEYIHECRCEERMAWMNDATPWWLARGLGHINLRFRFFLVYPPGHPGNLELAET